MACLIRLSRRTNWRRALATVATLASQPAFAAVKQQLRAPMLERLERLAASGDDPMVRMFNEV